MGNSTSNSQNNTIKAEKKIVHSTGKFGWSTIKPLLNSGDLIFFKSAKPSPTSSPSEEWSCVNVVIRFSKEDLTCLVNVKQKLVSRSSILTADFVESGSIEVINVDDKMRYLSSPGELTYSEICIYKQLDSQKMTTEQAQLLSVWLKDTVGTTKRQLILDEVRKGYISNSKAELIDSSELFSTCLAAEFFRALGIFSKNVDCNSFLAPSKLLSKLEANNVEFQNPIILQVDPSHKPRTWQNTINSHGDWGRHQSHKEMLDSQSTNEWCTEIPAIPTDALQMAKNLKNQSQESKDSSEAEQLKVRARNLFEIAKMNEIYYATNHPNDQKRMAEIDLNLQSLST